MPDPRPPHHAFGTRYERSALDPAALFVFGKMVLGDLGSKLAGALRKMQDHAVIDEEVIDAFLKEICTALLQADVNVKQVRDRKNAMI